MGEVAAGKQKPIGRPSSYNETTASDICWRLAEGESLRTICASPSMPDYKTVNRWLADNESFRQQYARARDEQAHTIAEEIVDRARSARPEDAAAVRVTIDALKWRAGKLLPKVYGDKLDTTTTQLGADGKPVTPGVAVYVLKVD